MGFEDPTPVQNAAIGPALEKRDLLVQAPTGTGKTCAFGIPTVEGVDPDNRSIQTVILCPTRELALQTAAVLRQLTVFKPGIGILALYGGEPIQRQIAALRRKPQIIVATPGRMRVGFHNMHPCALRYEVDPRDGMVSADGVYTSSDKQGIHVIRVLCADNPTINTFAYADVRG